MIKQNMFFLLLYCFFLSSLFSEDNVSSALKSAGWGGLADELAITFNDESYKNYLKINKSIVSMETNVPLQGKTAKISLPVKSPEWQTGLEFFEGNLKPGTEYVLLFDHCWLEGSVPYTSLKELDWQGWGIGTNSVCSELGVFLVNSKGKETKRICALYCHDHNLGIPQPMHPFFFSTPQDANSTIVFKVRKKANIAIGGIALMTAELYWEKTNETVQSYKGGPPANASWTPITALTDEFDGGKIDVKKWNIKTGGYPPTYMDPKNVQVKDGKLYCKIQEKDFTKDPDLKKLPNAWFWSFTTGDMTSREPMFHGYFEVKAKLADCPAASCCWFQDKETGTEIDLVETDGRKKEGGSAIHYFPVPGNNYVPHQTVGEGYINNKPLCDDFHIYSLEWDEKEIKLYFDGRLYERFKNIHCHTPQTLHIGIGFSIAQPKTDADYQKFPCAMVVDYVRAWKKCPGVKE